MFFEVSGRPCYSVLESSVCDCSLWHLMAPCSFNFPVFCPGVSSGSSRFWWFRWCLFRWAIDGLVVGWWLLSCMGLTWHGMTCEIQVLYNSITIRHVLFGYERPILPDLSTHEASYDSSTNTNQQSNSKNPTHLTQTDSRSLHYSIALVHLSFSLLPTSQTSFLACFHQRLNA